MYCGPCLSAQCSGIEYIHVIAQHQSGLHLAQLKPVSMTQHLLLPSLSTPQSFTKIKKIS